MNRSLTILNRFNPVFTRLEKQGFVIESYHSNLQGYGFYVEKADNPQNKYGEVRIFDMFLQVDICVRFMQRTGNCKHDIFNDIIITEKKYEDVELDEDIVNTIETFMVEQLNLDFDYCVEISAIDENGKYIENSDIFLPVFKTKQEAVELANKIDFQDHDKYELYIYEIDAITKEIRNDWRIK